MWLTALVFASFLIITTPLRAEEDIDVVYTWVDGSDEDWKATLRQFIETEGIQEHAGADALAKHRFRNHDELKYSLRSIATFAPWVHKIYIVATGQKPEWIKDHPKITFVPHLAIFKNKEDLPTYNSMAIESNLHRIPNLSDRYIYFNDDVFLGRPANPQDFYTEDGEFYVYLSLGLVPNSTPEVGEEGYWAASKNTFRLMNVLYQKNKLYQLAHSPFPSIKSVIENIEALHPDIFELVSSHHFRSLHDYTLTNGIIPFIALEKKWACRSPETSLFVTMCKGMDEDAEAFAQVLEMRPKFFCTQDSGGEETPVMLQQIEKFFTRYFSTPAEWEITTTVEEETQNSNEGEEFLTHHSGQEQSCLESAPVHSELSLPPEQL
jgi:hypothetical protein